MTWNDVATHWTAFLPRIGTRWPDLDPDDVAATDGNRAAFTALLAEAEGYDRKVAEDEIAEWLDGEVPADVMTEESVDNERILASRAEMAAGEDAYSQDGKFGDDDTAEPPVGRDR